MVAVGRSLTNAIFDNSMPLLFVFQIQITTLCMGISISATVALGCLFAPKVYIVLFQPHKNVRQSNSTMMHSSSSKSIRPFFGKSGTVHSALGASYEQADDNGGIKNSLTVNGLNSPGHINEISCELTCSSEYEENGCNDTALTSDDDGMALK